MDPKKYVRPAEFSRLTGISVMTIRRCLRDGRLPFVQPGGRGHLILIPVDALDRLRTPAGPADDPPPPAPPVLSGPKPEWLRGPGD